MKRAFIWRCIVDGNLGESVVSGLTVTALRGGCMIGSCVGDVVQQQFVCRAVQVFGSWKLSILNS